MSRLDELIAELCPDGVEYISIKSVSKKIVSGGTPKTGNSDYYGGDIPWLRTQEVDFGDICDTGVKITQLGLDNSSAKWIPANCVIVAMYGATVGKVAINKIPMTTNQACCNIEVDETQVLYKYLFHFLCSKYAYIKSLGQGSQTNINAQIVKSLVLPVPPLPVQEEIVRILDNFTELTAELIAELIARKKQYEYYRDTMLTFNEVHPLSKMIAELCPEGVDYLPIRKCVEKIDKIKWAASNDDSYHYIDLTSVDRDTHLISDTQRIDKNNAPSRAQQIVAEGDILLGATRPMLKRFCMVNDEYDGQICSTGFCVLRAKESIVMKRWLYYQIASTAFFEHVERFQKGASYPAISDADVKAFEIPIPSLEIQERIVYVLDNFEAICSDLSVGLPAEIEARQKQYECYRDKLLSFKEL